MRQSSQCLIGAWIVCLFVTGLVPAQEARPDGRPVSAWLKDLRDDDAAVRAQAAVVLGDVAPVAAGELVPALTACLRDGDVSVVRSAAASLGKFGKAARSAVPALVAAAASPDVRSSVLAALGRIGPEGQAAVPLLAQALKEAPHRAVAARALGGIGADARLAIPPLLRIARDPESSEEDRHAAIDALGRIGPAVPTVQACLIEFLKEPAETAIVAMRALARGGPASAPAAPALLRCVHEGPASYPAIDTLAALGAGGVPVWLKLMTHWRGGTVEERDYVSAAIARVGKPALPLLIEGLRDPSYQVQTMSATALGKMGPAARDAVPALRAAAAAAPGLREIEDAMRSILPGKNPRALAIGASILSQDHPTTELEALAAMGADAADAVPDVVAYVCRRNLGTAVRSDAVAVLGKLGPAGLAGLIEVVQVLSPTRDLEDASLAALVKALEVLARMGPQARAAIPVLEKLRDQEVRRGSSGYLYKDALQKIDPGARP